MGEEDGDVYSHVKGRVLYEIGESSDVGRYMVASRDISPGEVIFRDKPAVIGPDNNAHPLCLGCHRKVSGNYFCKVCHWPMCGIKCCQSLHHMTECAKFNERGVNVKITNFGKPCRYYDSILPLRVLLLKYRDPELYSRISLLMDHNEIPLDEHSKNNRDFIVDFIRNVCNFKKDFSEGEVLKILGILGVNSFVIQEGDKDGNSDLIGIYPWTSLMSHGCVSNTKIVTNDDFSYVCEALVPIPKGKSVVTNYHHYTYHFFGTKYRRADLKSTWSFDCACDRCEDPSEHGTYVSSYICDSCKSGKVSPVAPLNSESTWSCESCSTDFAASFVDDKIKRIENEMECADGKPEEMEKLLRRISYTLSENHYCILETKKRLIEIYGHDERYGLHKLSPEILKKKTDHCDHFLRVISTLSPGPSELKGYILWERYGAKYRLLNYQWLRMKISTRNYKEGLTSVQKDLEEIIGIFKNIKANSCEGKICADARKELLKITAEAYNLYSNYASNHLAINFLPKKRYNPDWKFQRRSLCA